MDSYSDPSLSYATLAGIYFGLFLFAVVIYAVTAFFMMKIFDKAGVQGKWRAWIPVYNQMVFLKLADMSPWLILFLMAASIIPIVGYLTGLASIVLMVMAAWRVGLKLQKSAGWAVLYFFLSLVWLGINAFDKSRWNPNIPAAPWAGNSLFGDRTVWDGIPVQPSAAPAAGYGAPQGYQPPAPQGYQPPQGYVPPQAPQGYQPPQAPQGFQPPAAPQGYQPPAAPQAPQGYQPPAAPQVPPTAPPAAAPPVTPPAPPAPPVTPPAPPAPPTSGE